MMERLGPNKAWYWSENWFLTPCFSIIGYSSDTWKVQRTFWQTHWVEDCGIDFGSMLQLTQISNRTQFRKSCGQSARSGYLSRGQAINLIYCIVGITNYSNETDSSSSTISTTAMEQIVDRLRCRKNRESTRQNYLAIWRCFNDFFIKLDRKPPTWEERVVLFVGYLADKKRCSSTIKSYISAIRSVLSDDGVQLNENKCLLNALTKATRVNHDKVRVRLPIHKKVLHIILKYTKILFADQPYLSALYSAIFITAYYGLFRVGELTKGSHPIRAVDVHVGKNKDKIMLILRSSKTHCEANKPQVIKIARDKKLKEMKSDQCPFAVVRRYTRIRRSCVSPFEPFFVFRDRTPVMPSHMRSTLKKVLTLANFNPSSYGTHGFRAGRAGDLVRMNFSLELVRKIGHWRSSAIYTYLMP